MYKCLATSLVLGPLCDEKLYIFLHFILHFIPQYAITDFASLILVGPFVSAKHCDPSVQMITDEVSASVTWQIQKI
jgi:hypothetical protein